MAEYQRVVPPGILNGDPERFDAAGQIALARGDYPDAIRDFKQSQEGNFCRGCLWFDIAQAYRKAGQPDSALAYFERYVTTGDVSRVLNDAYFLAATYQQMESCTRRKAIASARSTRTRSCSTCGRTRTRSYSRLSRTRGSGWRGLSAEHS